MADRVELAACVHDAMQLRITAQGKLLAARSQLDVYMLVPAQLDIQPANFSRELFYRYLKNRFALLPECKTLAELAEPACIAHLAEAASTGPARYHEAVARWARQFSKALGEALAQAPDEAALRQVGEQVRQALASFRRVEPVTLRAAYLMVNDYLGQQLQQLYLQHFARQSSGAASSQLVEVLQQERDWRRERGLPGLPCGVHKGAELQHFTTLQHFCLTPLLPLAKRVASGVWVQHAISGMAAALAMTIAMLIAFWSQMKYGNFTTPFLAAMVVGYILKDRVKEVSRLETIRRLGRRLFDYRTSLECRTARGGIASIDERFWLGSPIEATDRQLRAMSRRYRKRYHPQGSSLLAYTRRVAPQAAAALSETTCEDVQVINLQKLLRNAARDEREIWFLEGERIRHKAVRPRYRIGLLLRYQRGECVRYQRYDLDVTYKGIQALETRSEGKYPRTRTFFEKLRRA